MRDHYFRRKKVTTMTQEELIKKLAEVMREGQRNADRAQLPSESQERAARLMQEAIRLVEELTGEEWEFSYITL